MASLGRQREDGAVAISAAEVGRTYEASALFHHAGEGLGAVGAFAETVQDVLDATRRDAENCTIVFSTPAHRRPVERASYVDQPRSRGIAIGPPGEAVQHALGAAGRDAEERAAVFGTAGHG